MPIVEMQDEHTAWREQCRQQLQRPLALRERYGFVSVPRPILDDAPYRVFDSTAEYRQWCDENLPRYLGYKLVGS